MPRQNIMKLKQVKSGGDHAGMEAWHLQKREEEQGGTEMVRAMLAQSTAITALAAQIANMSGGPIGELASSCFGFLAKERVDG